MNDYVDIRNDRICIHCGFRYGRHNLLDECPAVDESRGRFIAGSKFKEKEEYIIDEVLV